MGSSQSLGSPRGFGKEQLVRDGIPSALWVWKSPAGAQLPGQCTLRARSHLEWLREEFRESCGVCLPSEQVLVRARGFWGCVFQGKQGLSSFSFPKSGGWLWSWAELRGTKVWVRTEGFLMEGKWGISDLCESQMEPLTKGKSCLESRVCSMAK